MLFYGDESAIHIPSPFVCVGGYLFTGADAKEFTLASERLIRPHLPSKESALHFGDCLNNRGNYKELSQTRRFRLLDILMGLTRKHARVGVIVGIERAEYESFMASGRNKQKWGTMYTLCGLRCFELISEYVRDIGTGRVSYVLEAGAKNLGELHDKMRDKATIYPNDAPYHSFTSATKSDAPPLQCADMVAWSWQRTYGTVFVPDLDGRNWVRNLERLADTPTYPDHLTGQGLMAMIMRWAGFDAP